MGYRFVAPNEMFTGENALQLAKESIKNYGKKAFVITGPNVNKIGIAKEVTNVLDEVGIKYRVFDKITGEPTDEMIDLAVEEFKEENDFDFLLAVGGGSPIDSMKAINAVLSLNKNIDNCSGEEIGKVKYPMIAIPTTAGTGSEATKFTIITDTKNNVKMLLKGDSLVPNMAIVKPKFTYTSGQNVTAFTALDAFCHASEAYTSRKSQPLTESLSVSAVKNIFQYLPIAYENGNDKVAREKLSVASLQGGLCINNSSVTLIHGMSRPIGALFHIPHGLSNAMLLPHCFEFAIDGAYEKFGKLAKECMIADKGDSDIIASEKFVAKVKELCAICNIPTLKEYGVDKAEFEKYIDKMATDALESGSPQNTIKECTKENIVAIYNGLW